MPNWARTCYIAEGAKEQLKQLYDTMNGLEKMKAPGLHENDFGSTWLGNLVIRLGGDWEKVYCRGAWEGLRLEDDRLIFQVESAWEESHEVRKLIEKEIPGLKLYYQSEEPDMGVYVTNDRERKYFTERFFMDTEDEGIGYYYDLGSLINNVESITGVKSLKTFEDCRSALESWSQEHDDADYDLEEFNLRD